MANQYHPKGISARGATIMAATTLIVALIVTGFAGAILQSVH